MRKEILRMERVSYQEQGVSLLDGLSLNIFEGEILGLVPVNDQPGVKALTEVICHNRPLHYGYVYYRERLVNTWRHPRNPHHRISLIQNRSSLAPGLTVAENVFVMGSSFTRHIVNFRQLREEFTALSQQLGVTMDPEIYAEKLTVYQRVIVELMKAIHAGSRLAILWDVCTFISPSELGEFYQVLKKCAEHGMSFLYISPHFEEADALCARTLALYNGQVIKSLGQNQIRPNVFPFYCSQTYFNLVSTQAALHQHRSQGDILFSAENLCSAGLDGLSFQVRQGECVVLQDMDNHATGELLRILQGDTHWTGSITLHGKPLRRLNRTVAIVQELAAQTMLFPQLSYVDNLCMTLDHRIRRIWHSTALKNGIRRDLEEILGSHVFDCTISQLTEQEKYDLVYTRLLLQMPDIVFCVFPFKDSDGETRMHICELIERLLKRKIAVVILAVNLADSLAIADRVLQVEDGQVVREYLPENFQELPTSTPWRKLYEDLSPNYTAPMPKE